MRQYHRTHQWRLSEGGLYIPHAYWNMDADSLSYWDDVGFILNGRRVIVWWRHPRDLHRDAIESQAWSEAGDSPRDNWLCEGGTQNYKRVGKSGRRKKLSSFTSREPSAAQRQYYEKLLQIEQRLTGEGVDLEVRPSWSWKRLSWAMGVSLVAPLDCWRRPKTDHLEVEEGQYSIGANTGSAWRAARASSTKACPSPNWLEPREPAVFSQ